MNGNIGYDPSVIKNGKKEIRGNPLAASRPAVLALRDGEMSANQVSKAATFHCGEAKGALGC